MSGIHSRQVGSGRPGHLRTHLFRRDVILRLPRFIEIKDGVGAQADGADGRVVQWSVLMRLGRKGAPGRAGAGAYPSH